MGVTLTQTMVDSVTLTEFGPVTLCEFRWARSAQAGHRLVSSAQLAELLARQDDTQVVSDIAALRRLAMLTEVGAAQLFTARGALLMCRDPLLDSGPPMAAFDGDELLAELLSCDVETIASRVFEPSFADHGMWALDAADADGPMRVPIQFKVSDRQVRIDAAQAHLETHPMVLDVTRDDGRPGGYDHVPASLLVTALFDDATWSRLVALAGFRYGKYRRAGERPPCPGPGLVSEAMTWHLDADPPAGDPLGLAAYRREDDYQEPDDYRY